MKRYVAEDGSELVRRAMGDADGWFTCRIGYVEVLRAVGLAAGGAATRSVREEWGSFGVIEVDQRLAGTAAELALAHGLRSLDALHLAAAKVLPSAELVVATWDNRLHAAAATGGLACLPDVLPGRP